jgi:prolyl-tRNA synthetase
MNATVLDQDGQEVAMLMGCYGIGVSRIVAAAIEQNHDEQGIIWPEPIAPYQLSVVVLNPKNSESVTAAADRLYDDLQNAGVETLLDDRAARPGVKFADADLLGIPHRLTLGERGLAAGQVEYRERRSGAEDKVALDDVVSFIQSKLAAAKN